jgi:hypothetical protein
LSFDVFCRKKPKSECLVYSRFHPDFAGMMRPGHDQSTPFGLSAVGKNGHKEAQKAQSNFLECGGKRSATLLWKLCPQSKAVSPLRSATAVQNPGVLAFEAFFRP